MFGLITLHSWQRNWQHLFFAWSKENNCIHFIPGRVSNGGTYFKSLTTWCACTVGSWQRNGWKITELLDYCACVTAPLSNLRWLKLNVSYHTFQTDLVQWSVFLWPSHWLINVLSSGFYFLHEVMFPHAQNASQIFKYYYTECVTSFRYLEYGITYSKNMDLENKINRIIICVWNN